MASVRVAYASYVSSTTTTIIVILPTMILPCEYWGSKYAPKDIKWHSTSLSLMWGNLDASSAGPD